MTRRRIAFWIAVAVLAVILLTPIRIQYKDGGTVRYQALTYNVIIWHKIDLEREAGYKTGTEFHLLPFHFKTLEAYDS